MSCLKLYWPSAPSTLSVYWPADDSPAGYPAADFSAAGSSVAGDGTATAGTVTAGSVSTRIAITGAPNCEPVAACRDDVNDVDDRDDAVDAGPRILAFPRARHSDRRHASNSMRMGRLVDNRVFDLRSRIAGRTDDVLDRSRILDLNRCCPECGRAAVVPIELQSLPMTGTHMPVPGLGDLLGFRCGVCEHEWDC